MTEKELHSGLEKELNRKLSFFPIVTIGGNKMMHFCDEKDKTYRGTGKELTNGKWNYITSEGEVGELGKEVKKETKSEEPKKEVKEVKEVKEEPKEIKMDNGSKIEFEEKPKEEASGLTEGSLEPSTTSTSDEESNLIVELENGTTISVPSKKPFKEMNGGMIAIFINKVKKDHPNCKVKNSNVPEKYRN